MKAHIAELKWERPDYHAASGDARTLFLGSEIYSELCNWMENLNMESFPEIGPEDFKAFLEYRERNSS